MRARGRPVPRSCVAREPLRHRDQGRLLRRRMASPGGRVLVEQRRRRGRRWERVRRFRRGRTSAL